MDFATQAGWSPDNEHGLGPIEFIVKKSYNEGFIDAGGYIPEDHQI